MPNETYHPRGKLVHGYRPREHPLYGTWADMKRRCRNQNDAGYENYGGRGITYCSTWRDFETFALDMWPKPGPEYTLERRNNNQGYSKENCTWATRTVQCHNRRKFKSNTTGFQGVVKMSNDAFNARFDDSGVRYNLGSFATAEEANTARNAFISLFNSDRESAVSDLERRVRRDSSTGVRGVTAHQKGGFLVRRTIKGVRVYFGFSPTLSGAVKILEKGLHDRDPK